MLSNRRDDGEHEHLNNLSITADDTENKANFDCQYRGRDFGSESGVTGRRFANYNVTFDASRNENVNNLAIHDRKYRNIGELAETKTRANDMVEKQRDRCLNRQVQNYKCVTLFQNPVPDTTVDREPRETPGENIKEYDASMHYNCDKIASGDSGHFERECSDNQCAEMEQALLTNGKFRCHECSLVKKSRAALRHHRRRCYRVSRKTSGISPESTGRQTAMSQLVSNCRKQQELKLQLVRLAEKQAIQDTRIELLSRNVSEIAAVNKSLLETLQENKQMPSRHGEPNPVTVRTCFACRAQGHTAKECSNSRRGKRFLAKVARLEQLKIETDHPSETISGDEYTSSAVAAKATASELCCQHTRSHQIPSSGTRAMSIYNFQEDPHRRLNSEKRQRRIY
jgi:hypothetical protein